MSMTCRASWMPPGRFSAAGGTLSRRSGEGWKDALAKMFHCELNSLSERHLRLPSKHHFRFRDIRAANFRIVRRQRAELDTRTVSHPLADVIREFEDGHFIGFAQVGGERLSRFD